MSLSVADFMVYPYPLLFYYLLACHAIAQAVFRAAFYEYKMMKNDTFLFWAVNES